jgi:hypothetical protein
MGSLNSSTGEPVPPLGSQPRGQQKAALPLSLDPRLNSYEGGVPSLLGLLLAEFRQLAKEMGQDPDNDPRITGAYPFLNYAVSYLDVNRAIQTFPTDNNLGIVLNNQQHCTLSPPVPLEQLQGTMQESVSIGVMEGKSQPRLQGVTPSGALPIR